MTIKPKKKDNFETAIAKHYEDWNRDGFNYTKPRPSDIANASSNTFITTRPEFNLQDYYQARPNERVATKINEIMFQCEDMYYKTGILRSIIELISEFIVDGLEILHEDPDIQKFYQTWQKKVNLVGCAEQLSRHLYRSGNAVIKRSMSTISVPEKNKMMDGLILAAGKTEINYNKYPKYRKSEIPIGYKFYKPSSIELVGDELGAYSDKKIYGLRIPSNIFARLQYAKTDLEKQVWNALPDDVKKSLENNQSTYITFPLPSDQIYVCHYKKDDMDIWAYPLTYSILPDLILNQKVKIAKGSALDGWYNFIRVWKLGDHKEGILPPRGAAEKLNDILSQNSAGGPLEVIWDSMIDVQELYPPIEKFNDIHEDKSAILELFSIPEELSGGIPERTSGGNNTGIKTKNFAKKLEAGRREINNWIFNEIQIIHRNMKFDKLPYLRYTNNNLMDEKTLYTLLRELSDRKIISNRTMVERTGEIPDIERQRIKEEQEMVESGELPPTASPFHNPNLEEQSKIEMDKIKLQTNLSNEVNKKPKDTKKPGRPSGSTDRQTRRRSNTGRTYALSYAFDLWNYIETNITESYLNEVKVSNVRSLTNEQKDVLDDLKTYALIHTEPGTELNNEIFNISVSNDLYEDFKDTFESLLKELPYDKINNDQKKMLKFCAYADIWTE